MEKIVSDVLLILLFVFCLLIDKLIKFVNYYCVKEFKGQMVAYFSYCLFLMFFFSLRGALRGDLLVFVHACITLLFLYCKKKK